MSTIKRIITLSFLLLPLLGLAQFTLSVNPIAQAEIPDIVEYKKVFPSPIPRQNQLKKLIADLQNNGYLTASIDSVEKDSLLLKAYLHVGKQYQWAKLNGGNVEEEIINSSGYREKIFYEKPFSPIQLSKLLEKILIAYENTGYPFATVKLDSIEVIENGISATLQAEKNKLVRIDSIELVANPKIAPAYLYSYLSIKPDDIYNERVIRKISTRIKELPFLTETKPFEVLFTEDETKLILYLENKRASNFNGILGVLPDNETGKILVTGDADLKLQNAFGRGEKINIQWQKIQQNTQNLELGLVYPFLFNTPFGVDAGFELYKRDTLFSTVIRNLGVQYLFSGGNYVKAFVDRETSSLLSTVGLESVSVLPNYADVDKLSYGLAYRLEKLDYRLNPRSGFALFAEASAGNKTIRENANVNPAVYDSLDLKTNEYKAQGNINFFIPTWQRSTIFLGVQGGYIYSPSLFENELYRIGGLKTLRGFDEESINANLYSIATVEVRYLLEQNSYAYLFWDGAYYENTSTINNRIDRPFGFGAGVSFETKAGIFSINYALGHQFGNLTPVRSAKIHFGFVSIF